MNIVLMKMPFYSLFGLNVPKMKTYPLNLLYLATYVNARERHRVTIVDGDNIPGESETQGMDPEVIMHNRINDMVSIMEDDCHPVWEGLLQKVLAHKPDLVGITCNSVNLDSARILTHKFKSIGIPVVLGGSHPTVLPEQSLMYTNADYVVIGEGESVFSDIIESINNNTLLPEVNSIAYRANGSITTRPIGKLIPDLNSLPIPDRFLINRDDYFGDVLMTSRGCPFDCAYCAARNIWGRKVRLRSIPSILEELDTLHEQKQEQTSGSKVIKIIDDTFTVGKRRTLELLERIIERNYGFEFTGGVRADSIDVEVASKMAEAGFKRVTLGIESGSPKILSLIRKNETNEDVKNALAILRSVGIKSHTFFMTGFPNETPDDMELSKKLILEARPDYVEINLVTPYPGTELFPLLIKEDPVNITEWYKWFHQGFATHRERLDYDPDIMYKMFADFASEYNQKQRA